MTGLDRGLRMRRWEEAQRVQPSWKPKSEIGKSKRKEGHAESNTGKRVNSGRLVEGAVEDGGCEAIPELLSDSAAWLVFSV